MAAPESDNGMMSERKASRELTIAPGVRVPARALRFTFARSGGPGGQHANKTSTRATLRVPVDVLEDALGPEAMRRLADRAGSRLTDDHLLLTASASRSQAANRRACLAKLEELVTAAQQRPRVRRPTRPSRGAVERRLQAKRVRGERKAARRHDRGGADR